MNLVALFVLLSVTLIASIVVFTIPSTAHAKISFCASGVDIFQCFIKENDCVAFAESHPETSCVRSKS